MGLPFAMTGLTSETRSVLEQIYPWHHHNETECEPAATLTLRPGVTPQQLRVAISPSTTIDDLFPPEFEHRFQRQAQGWVDRASHLVFWHDGLEVCVEGQLHTAMEVLLFHLALLQRRRAGGAPIVLHGGGVVFPETQRALMLVGPSGAGKSTLTTELCRHGLVYVSDEVLVLDGDDLLPYARAIGLRQTPAESHVMRENTRGERKYLVRPDAFGAQRPQGPARLGGVLALAPYCDTIGMEALSPVQMATRLLGHTYTGRQKPAALLMTLADICRGVRCAQIAPGEPRATAAYLVDWFRSPTGTDSSVTRSP